MDVEDITIARVSGVPSVSHSDQVKAGADVLKVS